jgi:hypothetical protein
MSNSLLHSDKTRNAETHFGQRKAPGPESTSNIYDKGDSGYAD